MTDLQEERDLSPLDLPVSKYIVLVGDGMGDYPLEELGGKTPLQAARTPAMDRLAKMGTLGRARTIPNGLPPGSDVANMSIMGYDPEVFYTGRGPLEAAAMGIAMNPEDVAFRCNLVTLGFKEGRVFMEDYSAGHISTDEAASLINDLAPHVSSRSFELYAGVSYRHLLLWKGGPEGIATVPPHDYTGMDVTEAWHVYEEEPLLYDLLTKAITLFHRHPVNDRRKRQGKPPANSLWPWGQGRRPVMATFPQLYDIQGAVVAAVDLIKGLGVWAGLEMVNVPGATGYLDTDYHAKAMAALKAIREKTLVFVHVEAPDEAGHMGDLKEKIKAIENFDKQVVGPVAEGIQEMGQPYRILVTTDHYTPISVKTHRPDPVPFVIYDSRDAMDNEGYSFCEADAERSGILMDRGCELMSRFIGVTPREVELNPKKK